MIDNELENKKKLNKIYRNSILHDENKQQIKILKINKCVSQKQSFTTNQIIRRNKKQKVYIYIYTYIWLLN